MESMTVLLIYYFGIGLKLIVFFELNSERTVKICRIMNNYLHNIKDLT